MYEGRRSGVRRNPCSCQRPNEPPEQSSDGNGSLYLALTKTVVVREGLEDPPKLTFLELGFRCLWEDMRSVTYLVTSRVYGIKIVSVETTETVKREGTQSLVDINYSFDCRETEGTDVNSRPSTK